MSSLLRKPHVASMLFVLGYLTSAVWGGAAKPAHAQAPGTIWVVGATYGGNCGVHHGNKTKHLAQACNGRRGCVYTIDYKVIGDPKVGCGKDYLAEWRCVGSPQIHRAVVSPEAGFRKKVRLSCGAQPPVPPAQNHPGHQPGGGIQVVAGTYGGNCGANHGNKTGHLAQACNGRRDCTYTIDYKVIGDPKVGCGKNYVAEWRCPGSGRIHRASASPEAGFRKKVTLSCGAPPAHHHRAGQIHVLAGTYGGNCGANHGNKTGHLAQACNGRRDCTYTIDYKVIGDPKVGCSKNYVAEWSCGGGTPPRRAVVSPEAGFRKKVTLSCR